MTDSIKTNSTEQESSSSLGQDAKDGKSNSHAQDERFDSLQKELLDRARKRADSASSNPPPQTADDDYVPASPTRVGQPAFQETDSDSTNGETGGEVEQSDTLPSFPAAVLSSSEQQQAANAAAPEGERKSPQVVMRAEVVVVDVNEQAAKAEREGPDRRESRRVMLRDDSGDPSTQEDATSGIGGSTREEGFLQSAAGAFDDLAADDRPTTSTDGSEFREPLPTPNLRGVIRNTGATREAAEPLPVDSGPESDADKQRRSKKGINAALVSAALLLIAVVGLFIVQRWDKPKGGEQPTQEPSSQTASPPNTEPEAPMTRVTSSPEGAELVHQGAVIGNTPIKVKRPDYEQIFLLRLPGYQSQLLRISPTSGETLHITLQAADTPAKPVAQ